MTQRSLVRVLLVGLPIGLAASIGVAVYLYYHPLNFRLPGRPTRPTAADLIRKSPTEQDLRDYRRILLSELPGRYTGSPALRTTANWLASTLGPTNLGLPAKHQNVGLDADSGQNVVVELPGRQTRAETIVVCTAYDSSATGLDSASSTALLMTVANAFVGLSQRRTVVFAFLRSDESLHESGLEALLASLRSAGRTVRGAIDVRVRTVPDPAEGSRPANVEGFGETLSDPWATEAWQALTARKPPTLSLERLNRAGLLQRPALLSQLPWWRQATRPPVPFLLLVLSPEAPDDTNALLALAQSLEGMIQALANQ